MKKILLSVLAVAGLFTAQAQMPTSGLVEHFTFNNTLIGVNGSNLAAKSGANVGNAGFGPDKDGRANNAQQMDSDPYTFDSVTIANMPAAVNQTRSFAFWFKHTTNQVHSFFSFNSGINGTNTFQSFYASYDNNELFIGKVDSNNFTSVSVPLTYNTNWTHVAMTFDGSTLKIYINGALEKTQAFSYPVVLASGKARFGRSPGGTPYPGYNFDEFVLYNRALTATEITQVYQAVSPNGIRNVEKANFAVSVFPNPATNDVVIETGAKNPTIRVADILGKEVYVQSDSKAQTKIATEKWANGVYLVSVESENQKATQRLVINR